MFHREGAFRNVIISPAPPPRWQSSRWWRPPARSRRRSRSTRRRCARSQRCRRARPRTSAASAARASRRRRSARRRTSRPTKQRIRDMTTTATAARAPRSRSCAGGQGDDRRFRSATATPVATPITPAARDGHAAPPDAHAEQRVPAHAAAQQRRRVQVRHRRLDRQLRRRHALQDRARPAARRGRRDRRSTTGTDKGTLTITSGDNFLAGLNLRASFQRFDAGTGPFYDSDAIGRSATTRSRSATTSTTSGRPAWPQFIAFERSGVPFLSANTDFTRRAAAAGAARQRAGSPTRPWSSKGGEQIGIIGVSPPETPDDLLAAQRRSSHDRRRRRSSTPRPSASPTPA